MPSLVHLDLPIIMYSRLAEVAFLAGLGSRSSGEWTFEGRYLSRRARTRTSDQAFRAANGFGSCTCCKPFSKVGASALPLKESNSGAERL